jgi:hypothetical protein
MVSKGGSDMPTFEYKTEVLTSMVGRDKLRMGELDLQSEQKPCHPVSSSLEPDGPASIHGP